MIAAAIDEHADWLRKWHRAVVCGLPPDRAIVSRHGPQISRFGGWFDTNDKRGLLDQPVFEQLWDSYVDVQEHGRRLALKAVDGETLKARDYDAFVERSEKFLATARRIRDAFQRAIFDLDPLTGVHNRRSMMAELDRERERSIRTGNSMCICLCDVDHFKAVNDRYGHLVGDGVLLTVAGRLIANLRPYDSIYRFGGEEFLLAFAETDADQAARIAERLRRAISGQEFTIDGDQRLQITASFGLALVDPDMPLKSTIRHADEALYQAKHEGRDRIALAWTDEGADRE